MKRLARVWMMGGVVALSTACVGSEVTYTGKTKYPAKPETCSIEVFPSTTPDRSWEDLATVEAQCHNWFGRSSCIEHLKKRACELGGDVIYDLKDGKGKEHHIVIATVARSNGDSKRIAKKGGSPNRTESESEAEAPAVKASGCNPPCSPGYECKDSTCSAVCNPACSEGMRCNQQRSCEPVSSSK